MYTAIADLLYQAESKYLEESDLNLLKDYIESLSQRLEIYKILREQELAIFQPIANQLNDIFSQEELQKIELALKYWIAVLRYCGMAMVINDADYLTHHILEWLSPQIQAHQIQSLSNKLFVLLRKNLSKKLSFDQFILLKPFIKQIEQSLLKIEN
jgi:Phycobilisome protein